MELNNREIAILIWSAGLVVLLASKSEIRSGFGPVLRALCQKILLAALGITAVWITLSTVLLKAVDLWHWDNLKTTLIWAITFAIVAVFDVKRISEDHTFYGQTVRDTLSATAAIEFVALFHSFDLVLELVLVPSLSFIGIMLAMAASRPEWARAKWLLELGLVLAGLTYLAYGAWTIGHQFTDFATFDTLREFLVPILLSLLFLPFMYVLSAYVTYEINFARLNLRIKDAKLNWYAKRSAVFKFRFDLDLLRRWSREIMWTEFADASQIRTSIELIKTRRKREQEPPVVPRSEGWSPYIAKDFLISEGLETGDYHPAFDGEWFASSKMMELGQGLLPDNMAYYVDGDERVARLLKLKLNVNNPTDAAQSDQTFVRTAGVLLAAALGRLPSSDLANRVTSKEPFQIEECGRLIRLVREDFRGSIKGYLRVLSLEPASSPAQI